ncbi:response regulator [Agarivorans gilvus]|uniref:Two-component system response regulator RssB n=1 Tax=Agarivorans gilvus TaxID=680279 RepID=A0ABQ1HY94_9ALTE|nr:response regulator [Agarivorans gilvus]GGA98764.1 two-component system response regulator RssB [Agarivorans gilvus]
MQQRDDHLLHGVSILVVEDEVVFRQQLLAFLIQQGAMVGAVGDGEAALEAIGQQHYDIILMDLIMPKMGGVELLENLAHFSGTVVVISGKSTMADLRQVMALGASDFLVKPITDFKEITNTILTNLSMAEEHNLQMEFSEFSEHKAHFKANDVQASLVLQEIMPEPTQELMGYFCHYRLKGQSLFPILKQIDANHVAFLVVDICLMGDEGVIAAVIINGFFQDMWNRLSINDPSSLQPSQALSSLNKILNAADLRAPVGCLYGVIKDDCVSFANAGLLDVPAPFDQAQPGLALGLNASAHYLECLVRLSEIGFSLRFKNLVDDCISLKLFPVA